MKILLPFLLLLIFAFSINPAVYAQGFPYQEYKTRTLSELIEMDADVTQRDYKQKQLMLHGQPFYSAVRMKYTGQSKLLSAEKKNLFKLWQETLQYDKKVLSLLESEYLFKECDKEYWIPVQKQVAAYFPKELKEGDTITLYLMAVGGLKVTDKWEFVFLTAEFQKY